MRYLIFAATLALVSACSSGPKVRTDSDPSASFASYRTYNFAPVPGTDRAGYSTLVTMHFRNAVGREMESRGYVRDDNPDLLVNFFTNVRERTEVQSTPEPSFGISYYRDRLGLYSAWPLYRRSNVTSNTYQVGLASIDVVDAKRRQLVWEGSAEGRVTDRMRDDPGPAISDAVKKIFEKYPARAGSAP